jgi:hypothetical protein
MPLPAEGTSGREEFSNTWESFFLHKKKKKRIIELIRFMFADSDKKYRFCALYWVQEPANLVLKEGF